MALRPGGTISGKIGAEIYSRNRGGEYTKIWRKPTNPNSPAQSTSRANFGSAVTAWANLTEAQQLTWEAATPYYEYTNRIGQKKTYTAQQLFIKCNSTLIQNGHPEILSIGASPLPYTVGSFPQFLVTDDPPLSTAGELTNFNAICLVDAGEFQPNERIVLYTSAPVSFGIRSVRSTRLRKTVEVQESNFTWTAAKGVTNILNAYNTTWNTPVAQPGQRIFLQWRIFNITEGWLHPYGLQRATILADI